MNNELLGRLTAIEIALASVIATSPNAEALRKAIRTIAMDSIEAARQGDHPQDQIGEFEKGMTACIGMLLPDALA